MARLEQSIGTSAEGGRLTMNEAALSIIEDYLQLVRRHLPDSIAEDILDELRDYMVEAAIEEGSGILSLESAKRTVARFGAPSEVAEEYRESMMLDEDDASQEVVVGGVPKRKGAPHKKEIYGKPVSIRRASIQLFSVLFIWSIITSIPTGIIWFLYFPVQLSILGILIFVRALQLRIRGKKLSSASYASWPSILRFFTLPFGLLPKGRKSLRYLEFILTGIIAIVLIPSVVFLISVPPLIARMWYIRKRIIDIDAVLFVKRDALVEFLTLISLNLAIGLSFWAQWASSPYAIITIYAFVPVGVVIGFVYGLFLLIRLAGITQGFWFESMKIREPDGEIEISEYEEDDYIEAEEDEIEAKKFRYKGLILRTQFLNIIWLSCTLFLTAILLDADSSFLVMGTIGLLITQLSGTIGLHLGNIARVKRKQVNPDFDNTEGWSRIRRFISFPQGIFPDQPTYMLRLDLVSSLIIIAGTIAFNFIRLMTPLIHVMLLFFTIIMGLRFIILNHRWSNPDSQMFNPLEIAVNLAALILGNYTAIQILAGSPRWYLIYPEMLTWGNTAYVIWTVFSIYLLYCVVARGGTFWIDEKKKSKVKGEDTAKKRRELKKSDPHRIAALRKLSQTYKQALGMIVAIYFVLGLVSTIVFFLNGGSTLQSYFILNWLWIIGLSIGASTLGTIQFSWRRLRIGRDITQTTIGNRTRAESIIDAAIMIGILVYFFGTASVLEDILSEMLIGVTDYASFMATMSAYLIPFAYVGLILAPFIRLVGDLIGMSLGENHSTNRAIIVSGGLFVLISAVISGIYGGAWFYLIPEVFYIITIPITLQVVTSYIKINPTGSRSSETIISDTDSEVREHSGMKIEENYTPPKQ
ncbi:MAG: hypothetical protein ACFFF4_07530 [Candidatus Thorarchaeota archaeon]